MGWSHNASFYTEIIKVRLDNCLVRSSIDGLERQNKTPTALSTRCFPNIILFVTPNKGWPKVIPNQVQGIIGILLMEVFLLAPVIIRGCKRYERYLDLCFIGSIVFFTCNIFICFEGLPLSHDIHHHLQGIGVSKYLLQEGELLSRWIRPFWGGIPFLRFYSPLPFLYSALWYWLDPIQTLKVLFISFYLFSAVSMYIVASKTLQNRLGALMTSLCYTLFGYHLVDSHVRAALGELTAFIWLPVIVLMYTSASREDDQASLVKGAIFSGILLSVLFLSHLLSGFMVMAWFVSHLVYTIIVSRSKKETISELKVLLLTILTGLGLSAFFIFPAMMDQSHFLISRANKGFFVFTNHFVDLRHLFTRSFEWHSSPRMPLYIGNVPLLVAASSIIFLRQDKNRSRRRLVGFLFLTALSTIVFSSTLVKTVFEAGIEQQNPLIRLITYQQFPWRSLELCAFSASLLCGYTVTILGLEVGHRKKDRSLQKIFFVAFLCIIISLDVFPYTGFMGGQIFPRLTDDEVQAFHWIQTQKGPFRVSLANYEYTYYIYASGLSPMNIGPGPYPEWRPLGSLDIFDEAREELRKITGGPRRWLKVASYLSLKYIVVDSVNLDDWSYYLSHDIVTIAQRYDSATVLENKLFRPYAEITLGTSDIHSPLVEADVRVTEFKSDSITVEVNTDRNENCYLTLKENYFVAWIATIDGKRTEVKPTENGLMCVKIDKNHSVVRFEFGYTMSEIVGRIASVTTLVAVILVLWGKRLYGRIPFKKSVQGNS